MPTGSARAYIALLSVLSPLAKRLVAQSAVAAPVLTQGTGRAHLHPQPVPQSHFEVEVRHWRWWNLVFEEDGRLHEATRARSPTRAKVDLVVFT